MLSVDLLDNNSLNAMRLAIDGMQRYHNQDSVKYFKRIIESLIGDINNIDLWELRELIITEQERRNQRHIIKLISNDSVERINSLSKQELRILTLVASGSRKEVISNLLNITKRTVANHKANISHKLGIGSTKELISFSLRHFEYLKN